MQNQEFKDHPENFKSIGDFTLDGEGGSDIPKSSAKKKPVGKANRQQSLGKESFGQNLSIQLHVYIMSLHFWLQEL